jgi:hypothetical protein
MLMHVLEIIPRVFKIKIISGNFLTPKLYTEDENDETFDFAYGTDISVSVHVWIQCFLVYQKNCQDLDSRCTSLILKGYPVQLLVQDSFIVFLFGKMVTVPTNVVQVLQTGTKSPPAIRVVDIRMVL